MQTKEINIGRTLERLKFTVFLAKSRSDTVLAFGSLGLYLGEDDKPFCEVRGFTIRKKKFTNESGKEIEVIGVSFPAYPSPKARSHYQTSFVFDDKLMWEEVSNNFLELYKTLKDAKDETNPEDIDLDSINLDDIKR